MVLSAGWIRVMLYGQRLPGSIGSACGRVVGASVKAWCTCGVMRIELRHPPIAPRRLRRCASPTGPVSLSGLSEHPCTRHSAGDHESRRPAHACAVLTRSARIPGISSIISSMSIACARRSRAMPASPFWTATARWMTADLLLSHQLWESERRPSSPGARCRTPPLAGSRAAHPFFCRLSDTCGASGSAHRMQLMAPSAFPPAKPGPICSM